MSAVWWDDLGVHDDGMLVFDASIDGWFCEMIANAFHVRQRPVAPEFRTIYDLMLAGF